MVSGENHLIKVSPLTRFTKESEPAIVLLGQGLRFSVGSFFVKRCLPGAGGGLASGTLTQVEMPMLGCGGGGRAVNS